MKHVVIVGGGISGLTAAYELSLAQRDGAPIRFTLLEASPRLGGIVETEIIASPGGPFTIECGPDGWVTEKPWARELAIELGLGKDLVPSNDAVRRTYLLRDGDLLPLPDGMRMMVPTSESAILDNPLLNDTARQAYLDEPARAAELRTLAANDSSDISVADFLRRHFGEEVTRTFGRPLLAGIFGGDIDRLSAASVMPGMIALEKQYGSLILGLQSQASTTPDLPAPPPATSIFSSLRSGLGSLTNALAHSLPADSIRLNEPAISITRDSSDWLVSTKQSQFTADAVILATPPRAAQSLLTPIDAELAALHAIPSSSAVIVALAFSQAFPLPAGFGFLVEQPQPGFDPAFLATTFLHQKYPHSAPPGTALLRVFFGGPDFNSSHSPDSADPSVWPASASLWIDLAISQLQQIWPQLPPPVASLVRHWPHSLPQFEIGHRARVAAITERAQALPGLVLLGNAYRGVGLPDLIRDARSASRELLSRIL
jgi:oxygen-dependent protoporphyrinogen oxidase